MRKYRWISGISVLAVSLFGGGCATTPDSIKALSITELQMLNAVEADMDNIVESYDAEVRHWVDLSFRMFMQAEEARLVEPDGKVDLAAYKAKVREVAAQMAAAEARYDKNKEDILDAIGEKLDKAMLIMTLINEYEHSTGVSPETWVALTTELGTLAVDMNTLHEQYQAQREAEREAEGPSFRDRLNLMGGGILDLVYDRIMATIEGGEPILPLPGIVEEPIE